MTKSHVRQVNGSPRRGEPVVTIDGVAVKAAPSAKPKQGVGERIRKAAKKS